MFALDITVGVAALDVLPVAAKAKPIGPDRLFASIDLSTESGDDDGGGDDDSP